MEQVPDNETEISVPGEIERDWAKMKRNLGKKVHDVKESAIKRLDTDVGPANNPIPKGNKNTQLSNTNNPAFLVRQHQPTALKDEAEDGQAVATEDGPEVSAIQLYKELEQGSVSPDDLSVDERRLVVKLLRGMGKTQDEVAMMLRVSRRTIVNDYRALKEAAALALQTMDQFLLGGEVYEVAQHCISKAIADKRYRTVSIVMRDMVEMLQSLGLIYRAPRTQKSLSLIASAQLQRTGFHKYMEKIGDQKEDVVAVYDELMRVIADPGIP